MSGTAEQENSRLSQERALQSFLLSSTIPLKEGGGLVFPMGLFGSGYRLDEWQFLRYHAALEGSFLGKRANAQRRIVVAATAVLVVLCVALIGAAVFLLIDPEAAVGMLDVVFDNIFTITVAALGIPAAILLGAVFYPLWQRQQRLKYDFPQAPKVSRFAHLRRHQLGWAAAQRFGPVMFFLIGVAWMVLGFAWLLLGLLFGNIDLVHGLQGGSYLVLGVIFTGISWVPWTFRLRHGRNPTTEDLEPL